MRNRGARSLAALAVGCATVSVTGCSPAPDAAPLTVEIGHDGAVLPSGPGVRVDEPVVWTNRDDLAHQIELTLGDSDAVTRFELLAGDVRVTRFPTAGRWRVQATGSSEALAVIDVTDGRR